MPKGRESAYHTVRSKEGAKTVVRKDSPRGKQFEKDRAKTSKNLGSNKNLTGKEKSTISKSVAASMAGFDARMKNARIKSKKNK